MQLDHFQDLARSQGRLPRFPETSRPVVCIQGLGFVGSAMAMAVASRTKASGEPIFDVIGVELDSPAGKSRAQAINNGFLPVDSTDPRMREAMAQAMEFGNLVACTDPNAYALADVVVVDVHLDLKFSESGEPRVDFTPLKAAIRSVALHAKAGALILVETTVPPGTCQFILAPEIRAVEAERGLAPESLCLAHSYERVMPGPDYFDSVVNFWRVYAADDEQSAEKCREFLSQVINVEKYPLTRLGSTVASETAKVLENSYRATTIAFMEEWGRFAEAAGIDMFEIVSAIRKRPTHSNIRQPGFGVGGYCLTKDPLFATTSAKMFYPEANLDFPFCRQAVALNNQMPLVSLDKLRTLLGTLSGKTLLVMGLSYRNDVADTRYSPSEIFIRAARHEGAKILAHDPMVTELAELELTLSKEIPSVDGVDAVVMAVGSSEYRALNFASWLGNARPLIFDANDVLSSKQRDELKSLRVPFDSIGRGKKT